ncbi:hypothetical protein F5Y17DRAFT_330844 [Xylariaceae sp. FL0594]|nr:hypothetical protein F5Y17DRAFT_330844 [Xylariaceae sp. FL0594]
MAPRTRKGAQKTGSELPSLFPTHDGSYGINTLISPGGGPAKESRGAHKSSTGIVPEKSDDRRWARTIKGATGKKHGMNSDLRQAINESQREVGDEHQGRGSSPTGDSGSHASEGSDVVPTHVPRYDPYRPHFEEEVDERPRPPFRRPQSSSLSPQRPGAPDQSALPASEHIPFYGMPQGDGSQQPISPTRPDSSRSYDFESSLFANATFASPDPPRPSRFEEPSFWDDNLPEEAPTSFTSQPVEEPIPPKKQSSAWQDPPSGRTAAPPSEPAPAASSNAWGPPAQSGRTAPGTSAPPVAESNQWGASASASAHAPSRESDAKERRASRNRDTEGKPPGPRRELPDLLPTPPESSEAVLAGIRERRNRAARKVQFSQTAEDDSRPRAPAGAPSSSPSGTPPSTQTRPGTPRSRPAATPASFRSWLPSGIRLSGLSALLRGIIEVMLIFGAIAAILWFSLSALQSLSRESGSALRPSPNSPLFGSGPSWYDSLGKYLPEMPHLDDYKIPKIPKIRHDHKDGHSDKSDQAQQDHKPSKDLKDEKHGKDKKDGKDEKDSQDKKDGKDQKDGRDKSDGREKKEGDDNKDGKDHKGHVAPPKPSDIDFEKLLDKVKSRMPDSVWVPTDKEGKHKISEDFWHALKELIQRDESILKLDKSGISDRHWEAIKSRLESSGVEPSIDTMGELEGLVDDKIARSWTTWLKQNEDALQRGYSGAAFSKDEFMKLFRQEAASLQQEIKKELKDLEKRAKVTSEQITKLQDEVASASGGMSRAEIKSLVESLVSKELSNAQLDAIARGAIKGHVSAVLANQVNFLWVGSGAAVDPEATSPLWNPAKHHFMSKEWIYRDGYKALPPMAAITPWSQEGECFCAGADVKGFGAGTNNITVTMSRDIVPQHLVVEHILPGATLDPGAMPKDIEIWAYYEELNLRREVQALSETYFPDTPKEVVLSDGWVKIGEFTYEKRLTGDGVQVFKLSDELARMQAYTNRVTIRALNNYGADHTCFYRLKLYGEMVDTEYVPLDETTEEGGKKKPWYKLW